MARIFALRSGLNVTLNIDGATKQFVCADEDESKDLFAKVAQLRSQALANDAEAYDELLDMTDPNYRMKDIAGLTRDNDGNFYLGNYSEPIPTGLMLKIKEYVDLGLSTEPLVNFWKLLMLNPDKHVRQSLFQFAERFSFPITDKGYFIAYKSVAWKGESKKDLALAIASEYIYKKASGQNTDNIHVYSIDDEIVFTEIGEGCTYETADDFITAVEEGSERDLEEVRMKDVIAAINNGGIPEEWEYNETLDTYYTSTLDVDIVYEGLLSDLYTSIIKGMDFDTPTFTDWHTRKSTIMLGEAVAMPREECDNDPNNTCSSGLHVGAPGYVAGFGGNSKTNYILACLVSPMNVVAVPYDYDFEKMRTCEYLPYAICKLNDDGSIREVDTRYFEEDYTAIEEAKLNKLLEEYEGLDNITGMDITHEELIERKSLIKDRLVLVG
jgi:hypothetical protein